MVNTTTASVSGLVGEREVKDLPLNGRSFDDLITLNPGTVNYTALRSPNTTTSNGNAFAVDGQRPGDNQVLLNGVEYTGSSQLAVAPGGVSGYLLGIDAVREFNVLTDDYGAEYGKREGAQVSVVTQSGSNTLHGTLYEFVRNSALDGRNYFDQGSIPPFQQNQFGGSLGGPIKKNRLFLFGNYEGFRQSKSVSNRQCCPRRNGSPGVPAKYQLCGNPSPEPEPGDAAVYVLLAAAQRWRVGRWLLWRSIFIQSSRAVHPRGFRNSSRRLHPQRSRHARGRLHHR